MYLQQAVPTVMLIFLNLRDILICILLCEYNNVTEERSVS